MVRIRSEFIEMQGFSPTLQQAVRLFHLSESECYAVLVTLVEEGFLRESADGRYRLRARLTVRPDAARSAPDRARRA